MKYHVSVHIFAVHKTVVIEYPFKNCRNKWNDLFLFLQYARECFCGYGSNLDSPPYVNKNDSECNMTCLQNPDEKCGGRWRMSVYRIMRRKFTSKVMVHQSDFTHNIKWYNVNLFYLENDNWGLLIEARDQSNEKNISKKSTIKMTNIILK